MTLAAHRDSCCFRMAVSLIGDCTRFDGDITRTADTVTAYLALRHPTVHNASSNKRLDSMHGKDFYACGLPNTHHQVPVWLGAQSFSYRSKDARKTKRTAVLRGFFEISQFVMRCPWKIQFLEEANYPLVKYMGYSCSIASPVFRR